MRARPLILLLWFTLLAVPAADAAEPRTLTIRGRVIDPEQWPMPGLTVAAIGSVEAETVTDREGRYALEVPLPSLRKLAQAPLALRFAPMREGWVFACGGMSGSPGLEIAIEGPPARARVRASHASIANAVAEVLAGREGARASADLDFTGAIAASGTSVAPVELAAEATAPLAGVKVRARRENGSAAEAADTTRGETEGAGAPSTPARTTRASQHRHTPKAAHGASRLTPAQADSARRVWLRADSTTAADRKAQRERVAQTRQARKDSVNAIKRAHRDSVAAAKRAAHEKWMRAGKAREDSLAAARRAGKR